MRSCVFLCFFGVQAKFLFAHLLHFNGLWCHLCPEGFFARILHHLQPATLWGCLLISFTEDYPLPRFLVINLYREDLVVSTLGLCQLGIHGRIMITCRHPEVGLAPG